MMSPPTAKQVVVVSNREKDEYRSIKTVESEPEHYEGSSFKAYYANVSSFKDVQWAYKKVKEANLAAAHIPCGYRICHPDVHDRQDYSDDGDYNLGREILFSLKHHRVLNAAVFVVRYYDGTHIGPERFNIVRRLTQNVLAKVPYALDYGQKNKDQELVKAIQKSGKSVANSYAISKGQIVKPNNKPTGERRNIRGRGRNMRGRGK